jgi:Asp-tRNA(Asn)/Glu-tRNA(Gln) amidotransferase A subunit family amidase
MSHSATLDQQTPALPALSPWHSLVPAFLDGRDKPSAALERYLTRINQCEHELRAFVHLDITGARAQALLADARYAAGQPLSPVDGMPVGVKDIIETRGMPTQYNSPLFIGHQPRRDAACVLALKRAGAIVVGKTVTTEFACGRSGPTRNPHDVQRTPGGSSSGSAAAVGSGMLPAALGTQTQASIIRPASYCGVVGYKPSLHALCCDGVGRLAPSLDQLGVLAADLEDARLLAQALAAQGPDYFGAPLRLESTPSRPRYRLAMLQTEGWSEIDDPTRLAWAAFWKRVPGLELHGQENAQVGQLEQLLAQANDVAFRIFAWEAKWPLRSYADCGEAMVGPRVHDLLEMAGRMDAADYEDAVHARERMRDQVKEMARHFDAFATLASSGPAPQGLSNTGSRSFAVPWTLIGGPAFSLPLLQAQGLPCGVQVMGFAGQDAELFGLARHLLEVKHEPKRGAA